MNLAGSDQFGRGANARRLGCGGVAGRNAESGGDFALFGGDGGLAIWIA
jgi:hypothetical protein